MEIRKAIITAAGRGQRTIPLQTLVDGDGVTKTALQILLEEIISCGVDEVCLVVCPGDQETYRRAAGSHAPRLHFVEQHEPRGYGDAVYSTRGFVADKPFMALVGDHLYVSSTSARCAQQLVEVASVEQCSVSAVNATHESKLPYYGTVGGSLVPGRRGLYEVALILEKPTPTVAEQKLVVPGLRAGHYLCLFGMHVLQPSVIGILEEELGTTDNPFTVTLSMALNKLATREHYLATELQGRRYDIGLKYGLLTAQLALAFSGKDREEVLASLVELLALKLK